MGAYDLDKAIRKIPDFPKPGILFYDITGILQTPEAFASVQESLDRIFEAAAFEAVAAVESRGFVFAAPLALRWKKPLILIRKKGKLPGKTLQRSFALEYGSDTLEVQVSDVAPGARILLVDDLLATGGTLKAAAELLEEAGGVVEDVFCVVGLPFLNPGQNLLGRRITTLVDYHSE